MRFGVKTRYIHLLRVLVVMLYDAAISLCVIEPFWKARSQRLSKEAMMRSFIVFGLVLVSVGQAQFGPDVRVSDTTGGFFGCVEPWIVAGPGDILYAVWASDYTSGFDFHIYFSRSTDLGNTWSPGKRIDDSPEGGCLYPSLAVDASGNLYCAWLEIRTVGDQIRFTRSTDGGMTWIPTIRVDDAPGGAFLERPHLVANQNELWVIWDDDRGKRPVNLFQRRIRNLALRVDDRG